MWGAGESAVKREDLGTGDADCHGRGAPSQWHGIYKGCGTRPAGGQGRPPLRRVARGAAQAGGGGGRPQGSPLRSGTKSAVQRADVGNEPSAASGRGSEVSEWPRSKFPASAVRQRRNFGHRNRVIRNTPAQRSRRTDCHSRCAHWLRNDMVFCKGCGAFPMVRRGGALPLPRTTARVAPTDNK